MKQFIQNKRWLEFKNQLSKLTKHYYSKMTKYQITVFATLIMIVIAVIVVVLLIKNPPTHNTFITYPIHHENKMQNTPTMATPSLVSNTSAQQVLRLQAEFNVMKSETENNYQSLNVALQSLQANISKLASQQDVQQLQQHLVEPNSVLMDKVTNLQGWVQHILQQTATERWVNPNVVQRYFHLVAIQGFSDGMRAIIDVDGNQTALSAYEICPVCRGWTLDKMDFANQRAIFYKDNHNTRFFVKLQAN